MTPEMKALQNHVILFAAQIRQLEDENRQLRAELEEYRTPMVPEELANLKAALEILSSTGVTSITYVEENDDRPTG